LDRLVGELYVRESRRSRSIPPHGDAQFPRGPDRAAGDLAAVRDEDLPEVAQEGALLDVLARKDPERLAVLEDVFSITSAAGAAPGRLVPRQGQEVVPHELLVEALLCPPGL